VGAQWVVAPLEPVRSSTFFFRDSPPLLTCVFHQTRRNFEPGSDPGSIYAAPANDMDRTPSASILALCPTTHGGIGRTLSLNALSPPFKVMLMLPHLCVVPRDSCDAKTDMQPENLKSFVAYSTTRTATSARASGSMTNSSPRASPSIHPFVHLSVCLPQSTQMLKTSKIDLFLLSGICSQLLSPQAFQTLPAATCSPAVNACFGGFLCSHIVSRYTAFYSVTFLLLTNSPSILFLMSWTIGTR